MDNPEEAEVPASRANPAVSVAWKTLSGLRKLQLAFSDPKVRRARSTEEVAESEARQRLRLQLKQMEAAARAELEPQPAAPVPEAAAPVPQPPRTARTRKEDLQPADEVWSPPAPIELPPRDLLADTRSELRRAIDAHTSERAAWDATRRELEGRLNDQSADSRKRAELQAALEDARAKLQQFSDTQSAELKARQDELKNAAHERSTLETALRNAQAECRQAVDTYSSDRATWEATNEELKVALERKWAEVRQTIDAHVSERAAWTDTRQQLEATVSSARADLAKAAEVHDAELEARGKELRAAVDSRATLEDALNAANRERQQLQEILDSQQSERGAWDATRQELEGRVGQLAAIGKAHTELETAFAESQASLRHNAEQYATERAELETRHQRLQAALDAAGATMKEATDAQASERAAWNATRQKLELRASELEAAAQARINELVAANQEQVSELEAAAQARVNELEAANQARVSELEAAAQTRVNELEAAAQTRVNELEAAAQARVSELEAANKARVSKLEAANQARVSKLEAAAQARVSELEAVVQARASDLEAATQAQTRTEQALDTTSAELRQITDAFASDRTAWDATRQQLEADLTGARARLAKTAAVHDAELKARATEVENATDALTTLEAALAKTQSELQQLTDASASDRAAWNATRRQLESDAASAHTAREMAEWAHEADLKAHGKELQEAVDARSKIEAALTKLQAESQRAANAYVSDRAAWDAARQQLESDVNLARTSRESAALKHEADLKARGKELREGVDLRARLEAALTKAQMDRQKAIDVHASDRVIWDATRHQLEGDLNNARAVLATTADTHDAVLKAREKELHGAIDARTKIEAALTKAQTEHQAAVDAYASDRTSWSAMRHELEARLRDAEAAERDRQRLQGALDEARARHAELQSTHSALEEQMAETTNRLNQLATESEALRQRVETEFHGDIRAELEERLYDARRLEEVGRLAGAMVPDIKQLVSSIDSCGTELASSLDDSDPRREPALAIVTFSLRASGLLRQLLAFSEKQSKPLAPVDVNDSVRRAEPVLDRLVGADVDLKIQLGTSGVINAGEDDVEHLVTALVFSARDLLPVGGSLAIETFRVEPSQGDADQADGGAAGHLVLTVKATGYGVQPPQASSALELVVQRCGGELYFDGSTDRGAVFQVRFPLARPDAQNIPTPRQAPAKSAADPASAART